MLVRRDMRARLYAHSGLPACRLNDHMLRTKPRNHSNNTSLGPCTWENENRGGRKPHGGVRLYFSWSPELFCEYVRFGYPSWIYLLTIQIKSVGTTILVTIHLAREFRSFVLGSCANDDHRYLLQGSDRRTTCRHIHLRRATCTVIDNSIISHALIRPRIRPQREIRNGVSLVLDDDLKCLLIWESVKKKQAWESRSGRHLPKLEN